jgi:hypothetical protein
MKTSDSEAVRKACWDASRGIGPHIVDKFVEVVRLRNKLARLAGYEDFFEYKVLPGRVPVPMSIRPDVGGVDRRCCLRLATTMPCLPFWLPHCPLSVRPRSPAISFCVCERRLTPAFCLARGMICATFAAAHGAWLRSRAPRASARGRSLGSWIR